MYTRIVSMAWSTKAEYFDHNFSHGLSLFLASLCVTKCVATKIWLREISIFGFMLLISYTLLQRSVSVSNVMQAQSNVDLYAFQMMDVAESMSSMQVPIKVFGCKQNRRKISILIAFSYACHPFRWQTNHLPLLNVCLFAPFAFECLMLRILAVYVCACLFFAVDVVVVVWQSFQLILAFTLCHPFIWLSYWHKNNRCIAYSNSHSKLKWFEFWVQKH